MATMMCRIISSMRMMAGWALVVSMLVSNSTGLVLCIGEDGHIAVEAVHQEHGDHPADNSDHAHDHKGNLAAMPFQDEDGGCVDVSLDLDKVSQLLKDTKRDRLTYEAVSRDLAADYLTGARISGQGQLSQVNRITPDLSQALIEQRTIVLLL